MMGKDESKVKAKRHTPIRSVAMLQLGDLILTAPTGLREQLATPKTLKGQGALCRRLCLDTGRYRLSPGGDRQANRALHMIAVCRLRYCPRTRAYAARRTTEGKTQKEIMRCLKRYIAARSTPPCATTSDPSPHPLDIYRNVQVRLTHTRLRRACRDSHDADHHHKEGRPSHPEPDSDAQVGGLSPRRPALIAQARTRQ